MPPFGGPPLSFEGVLDGVMLGVGLCQPQVVLGVPPSMRVVVLWVP